MKIQGIVFDKDGTLFDFNATWGAWAQRLLIQEAQGDEALAKVLADAIDYDWNTKLFLHGSIVVAHTADEVAQELLRHLPDQDRSALVARMDLLAAEAPQCEATDLRLFVSGLRARGLKLGVATNDSEAPARAHLGHADILDGLDFVAGYDSGWGGKPSPGQLLAFCEQTGIAPDHCLMVGDSLHDLESGQAAGMHTMGVLTGLASRAELAPTADVVLESIAQLPAWLDQHQP